jgi:hypothetical protein
MGRPLLITSRTPKGSVADAAQYDSLRAAVIAAQRFDVEPKPRSWRMKIITAAVIAATALIASAVVGLAGTANADPEIPTIGAAADVVKALQDQGYNVQYNMPSNMALARCTVSGLHGLPVMMSSSGNLMVMMGPTNPNTTVVVDLDCPPSNN